MEIEENIKQKKEIYTHLIDFVDSVDDYDDCFESLIQILDQQDILQKKRFYSRIFSIDIQN